MNVLHVAPYYEPAWAYGSVPRSVAQLAGAQAALGHRITVLTTDAVAPHERAPAGEAVLGDVCVVRVSNVSGALRAWLGFSTPIGLRTRARAEFRDRHVDVVHLHELRTVENLSVIGVSPPAVAAVVSPHGKLNRQTERLWATRAWDSLLGDRVLTRAGSFIARSTDEAGEILKLCSERGFRVDPDRINVIPEGVDLPAFARLPDRTAARSRLGLTGEPVVLFLSPLAEHTGIRLLVAAFGHVAREVPGAQLLVAGPDYGALAGAQALAGDLALEGSVRFAGSVAAEDRLAAFAAADLFALPATGAGESGVVLEALAAGVPVLIGADVSLREAAEGRAGRIVALDEDAWSAALRDLLTDSCALRSMREQALTVAARFTWAAVAASTLGVYDEARRTRRDDPLLRGMNAC